MNSTIFRILFFLFFILPETIHSRDSCKTTYCGKYLYIPVKYPFKLETDSPHKNCNDYINLKCGDQGQTIINLPYSGDFEVSYIDYFTQIIALSDPQNCLSRKLMTNSSLYPLRALFYRNYTFYTCPRKLLRYEFPYIECLSNSTNATIAVSKYSSEYMEESYGCKSIVSSMIPTSSSAEDDYSVIFTDLKLSWNVSGCKKCEKTGDSHQSKWSKILRSSTFIPSAVVLVTLFALVCFLSLMKLIPASRNNTNAAANNPTNTHATIMPQQTTRDTPPEATNGTLAIGQNFKVYMQYTELLALNEGQGPSLPNTCSICLDEYSEKKDTLLGYIPQCRHYFHAECIDHWLQKNSTCPVCRISLCNVNGV